MYGSGVHTVPLGGRHICFNLNSSTRSSSGVMVAHLIPTLHLMNRLGRFGHYSITRLGTRAWRMCKDLRSVGWDADRNNICCRQYVGTPRWGGSSAHRIAILEAEVNIFDIELQVRKNELSRWRMVGAGRKSQLLHRERESRRGYRLIQCFFSDLLPYNTRHLIAIEFDFI